MNVLRVCYKHGVRFDEGYYMSTHDDMVTRVFGAHGMKRREIVKVTATPDGSAAPYQVIFSAYFDSAAALQGLLQDPKTGDVIADIKNFYDGMPDVLLCEVLAG